MFDQKPNDRRQVQGVIARLKKERVKLENLAEKYKVRESHQTWESLEAFADAVLEGVEETPSTFVNYKQANQAHREKNYG